MPQLPTYQDVLTAAERLAGNVRPTPFLRSDTIDDMTGLKVWFKPECSQKVGAFKYRGAYNRLSAMSATERAKGVVAFSSGNHAQGVSRAAKELGISAIIVMPTDAPAIKVAGVKRDGAQIVFYDRHTESREDIAAQIAKEQDRIVVPSYDDAHIIAGQGTTGLEIAREAESLGVVFDALITPVGGGGLCAGTSLAMKTLSPNTDIFGAEPEHYNDHQLSLRAGNRVSFGEPKASLCDALMTPLPGEMTFAINQTALRDVFTVSDADCLKAMAIAKRHLGVQTEPGGVVAFAALLNGDLPAQYKTVCIILSGGNVDPDIAARADALLDP